MTIQKAINRFALAAIAVCGLTACSSHSDEGAKQGKAFAAAWNEPDSLLAKAKAAAETLDGLTINGGFSESFINAVKASGNADAEMGARLLVDNGEKVADDLADDIVDGLLDGKMTRQAALETVQRIKRAADAIGKKQLADKFCTALDKKAENLSTASQMKVYSAATTPDKLGKALKDEFQKPGADKDKINKQAQELNDIYNESDYATFLKSFK